VEIPGTPLGVRRRLASPCVPGRGYSWQRQHQHGQYDVITYKSIAQHATKSSPWGDIRAQLVAESLTWLHTPYRHQACVKGVGVDCVMLLAGVCKAVGLLPGDWTPPDYSPQWHLHQNAERLLSVLEELGCQSCALDAALPGDLLTFQYGRVASHVGLLLDGGYILHAVLRDCVRQRRLAGDLQQRLRQAYRLPGVPA
jgi:NlpC/P60 family putative phage cell wall peptidase